MTNTTPSKTADKTAVRVPQPHGGALLPGGVPGNKGGPGRPRSELRERLCGSLADRVPVLEEIADRPRQKKVECEKCGHTFEVKPPAGDSDRIKAIGMMATFGLGTLSEVSVDQVQNRLRRTIDIISDQLPWEQAEPILRRLKEEWSI